MKEIRKYSAVSLCKRIVMLCLGLIVMAFGVAFSITAALGTSPISSVPYVTGAISGLSVGTTTIIMNAIFVLIQIAILRSRYQWFQLLQLPAAILFGTTIDVASWLIREPRPHRLLAAVADLPGGHLPGGAGRQHGSGGPADRHRRRGHRAGHLPGGPPVKFGNMKMTFDLTLVALSIILSFVFLGHLDGVREGTIAAAVLVGQLTKILLKPMEAFEKACLN